MRKLLKDLTSAIVDHPDQVSVEEEADESGFTMLKLMVHQEDMGRVIGKEGKIIQALRALMRVAAMKQGKKIHVELVEPQENLQTEPSTPTK
ncbi:KH domain-containing protein [Patescibacteria group bacterium]|nr:KH domain-containing protein [Patescibacteria group bacterium]